MLHDDNDDDEDDDDDVAVAAVVVMLKSYGSKAICFVLIQAQKEIQKNQLTEKQKTKSMTN